MTRVSTLFSKSLVALGVTQRVWRRAATAGEIGRLDGVGKVRLRTWVATGPVRQPLGKSQRRSRWSWAHCSGWRCVRLRAIVLHYHQLAAASSPSQPGFAAAERSAIIAVSAFLTRRGSRSPAAQTSPGCA
jgi:hypothetical protein